MLWHCCCMMPPAASHWVLLPEMALLARAGAMLHCHCQTTGQVSPTGLYYELPSIQSMEGHTLSETTVGKYRQHWRNAAMLPRYGRLDFCY